LACFLMAFVCASSQFGHSLHPLHRCNTIIFENLTSFD
jgi:hypothetical protein